ncbi:hypothetical protein SDC9_146528 [bioreactor metagenome]|uniref:Uncharacterized protein n=1 Tax=bioreactor metagenome TaxID=1076179 RepID=A0A645EBH9_9ZZZZ
MQARILDEVIAHDFAGDNLMADVLRQNDEQGRHHNHDGARIKNGGLELRDDEEVDSTHLFGDLGTGQKACGKCRDITCDDCDKDWNDRQETLEEHLPENCDAKRDEEDDDCAPINFIYSDEPCSCGSRAGELKTDQSDDGTHGGRRQHDVNPFGAALVDDSGHDAAGKSDSHKPALCGSKAARVVCDEIEGGC